MPWSCYCLNGGVCRAGGFACECPPGFEGVRCEEVYINFDEISSQDEKETLGKPFIIFIVALFVLSLGLIVFFIWRRMKSIRRKKMKKKLKNLKITSHKNSMRMPLIQHNDLPLPINVVLSKGERNFANV